MSKRINIAGTIFSLLTAFVTVLLLTATPALAHHKADHDNGSTAEQSKDSNGAKDNDGDADSDSSTAYTEDSDQDGVDNDSDTTPSSHPSTRDRYIESGGSGNQGNSESNPDDSKGPMRYEGARGDDKPNGPGGTDVFDQDGNNGCGNDQDFNDDNNGHCGRPEDTTVLADIEDRDADTVLPSLDTRPSKPKDDVLGTREFATPEREVTVAASRPATHASVLPFTGLNVILLLALGLGLIAAGTVAVAKTR